MPLPDFNRHALVVQRKRDPVPHEDRWGVPASRLGGRERPPGCWVGIQQVGTEAARLQCRGPGSGAGSGSVYGLSVPPWLFLCFPSDLSNVFLENSSLAQLCGGREVSEARI